MKQSSSSRKPRSRNSTRKPSRGSGQSNGGNRVENRVRGNPKQLLDKYKTQARDARQAGDRVMAEHYHQFADHYQRILNEMRLGCGGVFEEYREVQRRAPDPQEFSDDDGAYADGDDSQPQEMAQPALDGEGDAGDRSGDTRSSRSMRAAHAEAEEQKARDRRTPSRSRRRRPASAEVAADAGGDTASPASEDDSPVAVSADQPESRGVGPRPRGRPRSKPAPSGDAPQLVLDEPTATAETDAA